MQKEHEIQTRTGGMCEHRPNMCLTDLTYSEMGTMVFRTMMYPQKLRKPL